MSQHFDVVIIGGGQAGLAMGYHLAQRGYDFVILDAGERTGDAWRARWDSLVLFTPARYSALPGMAFPAPPDHLPRKDEVADYLETYARHFDLPIRHRQRVTAVQHVSEWKGFTVTTETHSFEADQVVIATGPFQTPIVPALSASLSSNVLQMHSSAYRAPAQLPSDGSVLVVGGGNSGVQIADELARVRPVALSIGRKLPTLPQRFAGRSVFWWLETTGLMDISVDSQFGRRFSKREFLIGESTDAVRKHGVNVVGRAKSANDNVVFTADGAAIDVTAIIWATGFRPSYEWIKAPALDVTGKPVQRRGVTPVSGLYFLGMPWQHTRGSALLGWVGRDAAYIATRIAA